MFPQDGVRAACVPAVEIKFEQKKLKAKRIFVKAWMEMNSFCESGRSQDSRYHFFYFTHTNGVETVLGENNAASSSPKTLRCSFKELDTQTTNFPRDVCFLICYLCA